MNSSREEPCDSGKKEQNCTDSLYKKSQEEEVYQNEVMDEMAGIKTDKTTDGSHSIVSGEGNECKVQEDMSDVIKTKRTKRRKRKHVIDKVNQERESLIQDKNNSKSPFDSVSSKREEQELKCTDRTFQEKDMSYAFKAQKTKKRKRNHDADTETEKTEIPIKEFRPTLETIYEQEQNLYTDLYNGYELKNVSNKSFHIVLSSAQWETIKPLNVSDARRKLEGGWTDLLSNKVNEKYHGCVLSFKMNRVKSLGSRKTKAPYFNGKAVCKGTACTAKFYFKIEGEPLPGKEVEIFCTVEGNAMHFPDEVNKRQVKGVTRNKIAADACKIGSINYYYEALADTPREDLEFGNITKSQTPSVLRKIVSEVVTKEHLHTDIIEELKLLKETFENEDEEVGKTELTGYIQEIGTDPFTVVLVSREQVQLIRNLSTAKKLDIYIDATGSVVGNIPKQRKPYLYSVVVRPDVEVPPVSVADMVTTQHNIPRLEFFLASLKRAVEMGGRKMNVRKVETDFSWVFIQSALKTFNMMNIKQYLLNCFSIIHHQKDRNYLENFTVVHLCSAHMIKDFSRHLHRVSKLTAKKKLKRFAKQCFARLQNCVYLSEAESLFRLICTVLGSPHGNKEVNSALKVLEQKMKSYEDDTEETQASTDKPELILDAESFHFEGKTIKEISPFTGIFLKITDGFPCSDHEPTNDLYSPEVLTILTDTFLPLFPLWSGLMLQPLRHAGEKTDVIITRDTNAPVEGWFKAIKRDVSKKSHERPSKFVNKLRKTLKGRLKETTYPHIRKKRETKKVKGESEIDVSLKTEVWAKKKHRKTPAYHTVPKERLVSAPLPQVPSWGGEVANKKLVNTCTIDNCLTILYLKYLEDFKFRELLTDGVFGVLQQCCQLMESSKFAEAKAYWLENTGTVLRQTTDVFGDEYDLFINHIQDALVTKLTSRCSKPSCPEPYREYKDCHGVLPSTSLKDPATVTLDDLLKTWDNFSCDCDAEYEEVDNVSSDSYVQKVEMVAGKRKQKAVLKYYCSGRRLYRRQVVGNATPPVLFLRVYEMVRNSGFPADVRCYIGKIHVLSTTYQLVGATLYKPGHYTGVISTEKFGWLFYDGLNGILQNFNPYLISGYKPSHLVFVKET